MFHQVQKAIIPCLTMEQTISNWHKIVKGLAAPWRKRRIQVETIMSRHPDNHKKPINGDVLI